MDSPSFVVDASTTTKTVNSFNLLLVQQVEMTAYLANHQKKQRIFEKRERELRHGIKHEFPGEKLFLLAEKLRSAKLGVFKCRFTARSSVQPHEFEPEKVASHDSELKQWLEMSSEYIIGLYSKDQDSQRT